MKNLYTTRPYTQYGLTLVEIMVALTLSSILMLGVIQVFIGSKQTYRVTEASSRIQENGRFSIGFLAKDIRMTGFVGCASGISSFTNNVQPAVFAEADKNAVVAFTGSNAIEGFSYTTGTLPTAISDLGLSTGTATGDIVENTDVLLLRRASPCAGGSVVPPLMGDTAANIKIADAAACGLVQNAIVLVSDCEGADMMSLVNNPLSGSTQDTLTHSSGRNTSNNLSKKYGEDATAYNYQAEIYYIGNGTSGEPSLFRRVFTGTGFTQEELVEGVERMVLHYGEDKGTDMIADRYSKSGSVTDFSKVVSVRVSLLLRSIDDNITSSNTTVYFDGANNAFTDRRLRRVFSTTVNIRNRTL